MLHIVTLTIATSGQKALIPFFDIIIVEGGFILILWWRQKIIERYKERMRRKQLEDARAEAQEYLEEQAVLKQDNTTMNRFFHEFSKSVTLMNKNGIKLLRAAEFQDEDLRQEADALIEFIEKFSKDYSDALFVYNNHAKELPKTGLAGVDGMIRLMQQRAYQAGAGFDFNFSGNIKLLARNTVGEVDLTKLLGDLIQNAIIAVEGSESKMIFAYLSPSASGLCLDVMDSGSPFPEEVLNKLGKERVTSHADSGGSGFGMMTVFDILRKHGASFHLTEYAPGGAFSKKLSICFDGQNQFVIVRERPERRTQEEKWPEAVRT